MIDHETIFAILFLLLAIIGYFLRIQHTDVRDAVEDVAILKGQVQLIKQESDSKIDKLASITQIEMRQMAHTVETLSSTVNKLSETVFDSHKAVMGIFKELRGGNQ